MRFCLKCLIFVSNILLLFSTNKYLQKVMIESICKTFQKLYSKRVIERKLRSRQMTWSMILQKPIQ